MTLRITCIGRHGQVAQALQARAAGSSGIELIAAGRETLNLKSPASLAAFLDAERPAAVMNAAAYNFVDRAESEPEEAMGVNADGPAALARLCRARGLPFIHLSTDMVFDGTKIGAYVENDAPNPLSAYGRSKLAGERAVLAEDPDALVTRVCWVFSEFAESFVAKMLGLARDRAVVRVVVDQVGAPTYAPDIADALLAAVQLRMNAPSRMAGLRHIAANTTMTRVDMARAVFAESRARGGPTAEIESVTTAEFAAAAPRPLNAHISGARAALELGLNFTPIGPAIARSVAGVLARPA